MAYKVSNRYKEIIYSGNSNNELKVLFNNVEYQDIDSICESLNVKSKLIAGTDKRFSLDNFIAKEATLVLHEIDTNKIQNPVNISIGTLVDGTYEYVPIGVFNIQDKPTTDHKKTTIKLRDNAVLFDFNYNGKPLIDLNGGKATKMQVLQDICNQANVELGITTFNGANDLIGIYDNTIKARTYISYLAEQAGGIATIDRSGKLIFVYLKDSITHKIPIEIVEKYEDGKPYEISRVVYEDAIRKYEAGDNTKDNLFINSANPYISNQEQIDKILLLNQGITINSFKTGKILGNPAIDCYDYIEITEDGKPYKTLASNEFTYNGAIIQTFETTIGEEARKENVSVNSEPTFKKWAKTEIDNVNSEIKLSTGKIDDNSKSISELNIKTGTISAKLSETTQKTEQLTKDVETNKASFEDFKNNEYIQSITNIQNQIDGAIQFWNGQEIPTINNYPANEWTTENEKINHTADIYTVIKDVNGEMKQGKSYRFDKVKGVWQWIELTDNELSAVQKIAEEANNRSTTNASSIKTLQEKNVEIEANLNGITTRVSSTETKIEKLTNTVDVLAVDLETNNIVIATNNNNIPFTTASYTISYNTKYAGQPINIMPTTKNSYTGIGVSIKQGQIIFNVANNVSIPKLDNIYKFDFVYQGNTITKTIVISLAKQGIQGQTGAAGKDGTNGSNGKDGTNGTNGKSAYQLWLDAGNVGTEQDYLNSLKGKDGTNGKNGQDGKPGATGPQGPQGEPGKNGTNGTNGKDGAPGKQGPQGNPGKDGSPGAKGDTGPQGPKGNTGPAGKDAAIQSTTPPADTTQLWYDINNNQLKRWNGTNWEIINDFSDEIDDLNNRFEDYYTKTTINELIQNSETGLTNKFTESGGNNIFRNTGLWFKENDGSYEYWTGRVKKTSNDNATGYNAMLLQKGELFQEQEVPNGQYSISFWYKKLITQAKSSVLINGKEYLLNSTELTQFYTGEIDNESGKYITFPIDVTANHINIKFKTDIDNSVLVYDIMCNRGVSKQVYTQNQNETTTDTVNISKGITITSTDTDTKFKADADGIRLLDQNDNIKTKFTDKGMETVEAKITNKAEVCGTLTMDVDGQTWFTRM